MQETQIVDPSDTLLMMDSAHNQANTSLSWGMIATWGWNDTFLRAEYTRNRHLKKSNYIKHDLSAGMVSHASISGGSVKIKRD